MRDRWFFKGFFPLVPYCDTGFCEDTLNLVTLEETGTHYGCLYYGLYPKLRIIGG